VVVVDFLVARLHGLLCVPRLGRGLLTVPRLTVTGLRRGLLTVAGLLTVTGLRRRLLAISGLLAIARLLTVRVVGVTHTCSLLIDPLVL